LDYFDFYGSGNNGYDYFGLIFVFVGGLFIRRISVKSCDYVRKTNIRILKRYYLNISLL